MNYQEDMNHPLNFYCVAGNFSLLAIKKIDTRRDCLCDLEHVIQVQMLIGNYSIFNMSLFLNEIYDCGDSSVSASDHSLSNSIENKSLILASN